MTEEISRMVQALKYKMRADVCAKYLNCKGCPIKDSFKVDLCDAIFLYETMEGKAKKDREKS